MLVGQMSVEGAQTMDQNTETKGRASLNLPNALVN